MEPFWHFVELFKSTTFLGKEIYSDSWIANVESAKVLYYISSEEYEIQSIETMEAEGERWRWYEREQREVWIIDFQKWNKLNITEAQLCCAYNLLS